jgi:SAM-dependent methyltransferase
MPYIKEVFDVTTFEQAKHVVLTSDPNNPDKFVNETNFLINTIAEQLSTKMNESSIVLDFGCGMGRVSKSLIEKFNCKVIGLDISDSMLTFARLYTANVQKFQATKSYTEPDSIDVCLSILALQHSENPVVEINNIVKCLKPGGVLVLLNEPTRFVPSDVDSNRYVVWNDDGFDIFGYIESLLTKVNSIQYMNSKLDIIFYRKQS